MSEATILDKVEHAGRVNALYDRADSLHWDLRRAVEELTKRQHSNEPRFPDYRSRIQKVQSLLDQIESTVDRARHVEFQPQPKEDV